MVHFAFPVQYLHVILLKTDSYLKMGNHGNCCNISKENVMINSTSFCAFAHFRIISSFPAQTYYFTLPSGINILLDQTRQQILSFTYITFWQKRRHISCVLFFFFFFLQKYPFTIPIWLAAQNFCDKTKSNVPKR